MADETHEKRLIVDDDWKAEARREKERLAEQTRAAGSAAPLAGPTFAELVNLVAMQALVALGMVSGPAGERIPPNLEAAKHFIDLLQLLEDKTRNNLTEDEQRLLQQVLYELRLQFVNVSSAGPAPGAAEPR